ncbi:MAG: hypothetical protein RLZZ511_1874, partial [Cyanobacteriota bacterium]
KAPAAKPAAPKTAAASKRPATAEPRCFCSMPKLTLKSGCRTVDIGASLMSVSPKVALDFFRAVKEVSVYLESNDLRAWAELGKRIALNSSEEASDFFRYSAETLGQLHRIHLIQAHLI